MPSRNIASGLSNINLSWLVRSLRLPQSKASQTDMPGFLLAIGFLPSVSISTSPVLKSTDTMHCSREIFLDEMPATPRPSVCRSRLISMMEPSGHKISKEYFAPDGAPSPVAPEISQSETSFLLLSMTDGEIGSKMLSSSTEAQLGAPPPLGGLRADLLLFFFAPPVMRATSSLAILSSSST